MKRSIIELNEALRIQKIKDYAVLDTEPEKLFDDITKLAAHITNCPVAIISIIDENRMWFKSKVGLTASEIPRKDALCNHVIMQSQYFEVPNAQVDPRFRENPFVKGDFNLRFYAGIPLTTPDGFNLGTLCVIDVISKTLSVEQREQLMGLANVAVNLLEMRRINLRLTNLEVQASEAEKLATMGVFASGICHEINNPLSVITTSAEILKYEIENDAFDKESALQLCDAIFNTSVRIGKIVKALKILSHKNEKHNFSPVLASEVFSTVLSVTENKIKKAGVNYSYEIPSNLYLRACEVGVAQILTNLIHNAFDAVIGTEDPWIKVTCAYEGERAKIQVVNSGSKIPSAVVEKMFFPFFTTKEEGKGTGLGLSISRNIAEDCKGRLEYEASEEHTTFSLSLVALETAEKKAS